MQNKNDQDNDRICVRCKSFFGISDYQYHCTKCYQETQGNQAKPDLLSDAELQQHRDNIEKIEEQARQKLKEEEEKKKKFWQYQFEDKYDRGRHQQIRMLRNWNGGKVLSPLRNARLQIQEVLFEDSQM